VNPGGNACFKGFPGFPAYPEMGYFPKKSPEDMANVSQRYGQSVRLFGQGISCNAHE
jgi:hypothetical protein